MSKTRFFLMNKDNPILKFDMDHISEMQHDISNIQPISDVLPLQLNLSYLKSWIETRKAPKHRAHIKELLEKYNCDSLEGFIKVTHALSLNDTFWIKGENEELKWSEVSLYQNDFDEVIAKIAFEGGHPSNKRNSPSPEFSTDGAYAKCWIRENEKISLIKAGSKDGVEPYSEYYASQLSKLLCKDAVSYDIVVYHNKITGKCSIFTSESEGFLPVWKFADGRNHNDMMRFYSSIGCEQQYREMLILDALILNIDRHGGNHGVMIKNDTQEVLKMAPVFDHNRSLLYNMKDFELKYYEHLVDDLIPSIGNNFVDLAKEVSTPQLIKKVYDLHGFTFERHQKYNLPEERITVLEEIVNSQIENITKGLYKSIGFQKQPEFKPKPLKAGNIIEEKEKFFELDK